MSNKKAPAQGLEPPVIHHINGFPFGKILSGYTTRLGGVSFAPYNSLNTGFNSGDIQENVLANRKKIFHHLNQSLDKAIFPRQTHTSNIQIVDSRHKGSGAINVETGFANTDGLFTDDPNPILLVQTADCLPIFLCDAKLKVIGILHAGWRGTVKEILVKGIQLLMNHFKVLPTDIYIHFGPCIKPCCYEVGDEVVQQFTSIIKKNNRFYADIVEENRIQALQNGVPASHITQTKYCTYCEKDLFFSYRRDGIKTGRMASFIALSTYP